MIVAGTVSATAPDPSCSTGCPYCGCVNPGCYYGQDRFTFMTIEPVRSPLADEIEALKRDGKRAIDRPWVDMKRAPRRYGRS